MAKLAGPSSDCADKLSKQPFYHGQSLAARHRARSPNPQILPFPVLRKHCLVTDQRGIQLDRGGKWSNSLVNLETHTHLLTLSRNGNSKRDPSSLQILFLAEDLTAN